MARSSLSLSLIVSLLVMPLKAQEETFLRAHMLYRQGDHNAALNCCSSLQKKGPGVWYLMGRCAHALKDYCHAHLFLQRAQQGASVQLYTAIHDALHDLYTDLGDSGQVPADGMLSRILMYTNHIPLWHMQCICIALWYLVCILWWFKQRVGKILLVCAFGFFSICGVIFAVRYYDQHVVRAIVRSSCPLYAGPHENYHTVATVYDAECVHVIQEYASWYNVKRTQATGDKGWILKEALILV